jgi:DNA-binding Xre family transcriptional regulator
VKVIRRETKLVYGVPERLSKAWRTIPRNITAVQMCREAGISTNFWYGLLNGNVTGISWPRFKTLCKVLGLGPSEFVEDWDPK